MFHVLCLKKFSEVTRILNISKVSTVGTLSLQTKFLITVWMY